MVGRKAVTARSVHPGLLSYRSGNGRVDSLNSLSFSFICVREKGTEKHRGRRRAFSSMMHESLNVCSCHFCLYWHSVCSVCLVSSRFLSPVSLSTSFYLSSRPLFYPLVTYLASVEELAQQELTYINLNCTLTHTQMETAAHIISR